MSYMLRRPWLLSILALCLSLLGTIARVEAAAPTGITVSPFIQQISLGSYDTQKSFQLTLTNHTTTVQELDLKSQDFGSLNNTGGIVLEGSNTYTQKYGLVSWLTLSSDTIVLSPGQSQSVEVTIDNRNSLQPGGHYGAVVASLNSLGAKTGNRVQINQQLSALILVDKTGGEHYDLQLDTESLNGNWLHLPTTARLVFKNPGNVHVVPRGLVKLETSSGKVVAQGIINSESAFILPEAFRQLYVPLTQISKTPALPGSYKLVVSYRYDGISGYANKTYRVHFLGLQLYFLLALLVLATVIIYRQRQAINKTLKQR